MDDIIHYQRYSQRWAGMVGALAPASDVVELKKSRLPYKNSSKSQLVTR